MVIPQFFIVFPFLFIFPKPSFTTFEYLTISSIIHTSYIIFLGLAYKEGQLSHVFPLAAGTAPLLALGYGWLIDGHSLSSIAIMGIIILCTGIMSLVFIDKSFLTISMRKSTLYAVMTSFFIFGYALIDANGVLTAISPLQYIVWLFALKALLLFIPMCFLGKIKLVTIKMHWPQYLSAGLIAGAGYAVIVWTFSHREVEVILALRSTSILFTMIMSIFLLKESFTWIKMLSTSFITLGLFLILLT
jgi:drug/metabolite transporter (DMT)-like permease